MFANLIVKRCLCSVKFSEPKPVRQPNWLKRVVKKFTPSIAAPKTSEEIIQEKYLALGVPLLYANCSNGFDYKKFIERYKLPDTFDTWFRLSYLHLWIVLLRISNENKDFYDDFREDIIPLMWKDCIDRIQRLKKMPDVTITNRQINAWTTDFYYELFFGVQDYDEAFLSGDAVLAGALWRNVYNKSDNYDVIALNNLVRYVRMHVYLFHKTNLDTLMTKGVKWQFDDHS